MSTIRSALLALIFGGSAGLSAAQALLPPSTSVPSDVLRVCADPNNLPLSNDKGEGYENQIAEAMARDMGRKLEYTWYPQRMGFIRSTLRAREPNADHFRCDLVIGVPKDYELTASTVPYMHSTWALVFRKSGALAGIRSAQDLARLPADELRKLRFGIFGRSPAADWLLDHDLFEQATVYAPQSGDPKVNPNSVVEDDLRAGKIDVAAVWGPIAGGFVRRDPTQWGMAPFAPSDSIQFDFEISMGVRFGEKPWKDTVEGWIRSHQATIDGILKRYEVPLLALSSSPRVAR